MQKVSTCLWFDKNAEEAVNLYVSLFPDSKILSTSYYDEAGSKAAGMPAGTVMTIMFKLAGQEFMALNGGPLFKFTPAVSIMVNCENQDEVDKYWNKLTEGGKPGQCGWLEDKYGFSWQIIPTILGELMTDKDAKKAKNVMEAMLKMNKIEIDVLKEAYNQ
jgi:predicted 3-demethylubiquinone-9 3-methyltransferase (glyoxalase superfamily)